MKSMSKRPAGSLRTSRILSGGIQFGGKSLFLPTTEVPVVMQALTRSQIEAIPKTHFSVKEFGGENRKSVRAAIETANKMSGKHTVGIVTIGDSAINSRIIRFNSSGTRLRKQRKYYLLRKPPKASRFRPMIGLAMFAQSLIVDSGNGLIMCSVPSSEPSSLTDEQFITVIKKLEEAKNELNSMRHTYNNGGGPPPPSTIFKPGIDERRMIESIKTVRRVIMGDQKECSIGGITCKFMDFCVLTFLTLSRMHFIKNITQKAFCEFLNKEELFGSEKPRLRTFNKHFHRMPEDYLKTLKGLPFNPTQAPEKRFDNDVWYKACHTLAKAFHNTNYFVFMRNRKKQLEELVL